MVKKQKFNVVSGIITAVYMFVSLILAVRYIKNEYPNLIYDGYASFYVSRINPIVQIITYLISFLCATVVVFFVIEKLYQFWKMEKREKIQLIGLALPILICLIKAFVDYGSAVGFDVAYYSGDEYNIWSGAIAGYPFSFVYTSFVFLVSTFIFPFRYGPIICKLLLTLFVVLYIVTNTAKRTNKTFLIVWEYILFLGGVYIGQSVNTHRMFWYALVYVYICAEMFFIWHDTECGERYSKEVIIHKIIVTSVGFALLSVWRREGIYLVVFSAIYWLVYSKKIF